MIVGLSIITVMRWQHLNDCLHYNGLVYKYEEPLELEGQIKRPDFTAMDPDTDEISRV